MTGFARFVCTCPEAQPLGYLCPVHGATPRESFKRLTVPMAAKMYGIPIVDYCEGDVVPDRWGVLVGSGCGLMMSVMDEVSFRWCVDADVLGQRLTAEQGYRLAQFITMANAAPDGGVALSGWFSITDPAVLREAFRNLTPPGVVYAGHMRLDVPGEVDSLAAFIKACRDRWDPFTRTDSYNYSTQDIRTVGWPWYHQSWRRT